MSCKYCNSPVVSMVAPGTKRWGWARVEPYEGLLAVEDRENAMRVRIIYCPMCGRKLSERGK